MKNRGKEKEHTQPALVDAMQQQNGSSLATRESSAGDVLGGAMVESGNIVGRAWGREKRMMSGFIYVVMVVWVVVSNQ